MASVRTYPNLGKQNKFLGLELYDWGVILIAYALVFLISVNFFLNLVVLSAVFVALFMYKRKKPSGYTASLIRFFQREKTYSVRRETQAKWNF